MQVRPTVLLALTTRRSFLDHYYDQGAPGVFVPGYVNQSVGAEVDLEIAFAEEQMVFHSRGLVRSKRLVGRKDMPAGIGVEFLSSERRTRELLLKFANGHEVQITRRRSRRLPISLQVECTTPDGKKLEMTEDLSREGAFIRTDAVVPIGTIITVRFKPPGQKTTVSLKAEVMWQRHSERPGIGVRFVLDDSAPQRALAEFIDQVKDKLAG
jgi:uncharacterized protein (TIGR02266 family)